MSKRGLVLMATLAVASGVLVTVGLFQRLTGEARAQRGARAPVPVVVAREELPRGTTLHEGLLAMAQFPSADVPLGAFTDPKLLTGRFSKERIPQGAPILEGALFPAGHRSLLQGAVPPGYRAVGVFVDPRGGIQRYLSEGDRVDVVVTMEDEQGMPSSKVLLQDVEVLAVPEVPAAVAPRPGAMHEGVPVALAATPQNAEKLSLAMQIGTLQLLIRSYADAQPSKTSGVTKDTLLPAEAVGPVAMEEGSGDRRTYRVVEVIRGQQRTRQRFRESAGSLEAPAALTPEVPLPPPPTPDLAPMSGLPPEEQGS